MAFSSIKPIQIDSLSDVVYRRLRDAIIAGQFQPGERLAETSLSVMLGVSRSPIREALQRLAIEGLIESRKNRANYVWEPTESDIREVFSIRSITETLACELVMDKFHEEDYHNLERLIWFAGEAAAQRDFNKLIQEDKKFHEYILTHTGHRRLFEIWKQIIGLWEMLAAQRFRHFPDSVPPTVVEDHHLIIQALKSHSRENIDRANRAINDRVMLEMIKMGRFKPDKGE